MASKDRAVYRFEEFCLDSARGTLREPGGAEIALRPKAFSLLRHLLDHPGVLHSREALLDTLWPGVVVTDDSLTQCVGDLRRALGDRATAVLRTLPRRGYMLVAPVQREPVSVGLPAAQADSGGISWRPVPADGDLLVVEPLEPVSEDTEARRFARTLDAELLMAFSFSEMLHVLTRPTLPLPPQCYRLSGTVRQAAAEPLIELVLEDVDTSRVLWADQLTLAAAGQRDRALAILLARLEMYVTGESVRRARHKAPHALQAYDFVRLGREFGLRGGEADTREAQRYFLRATAMDQGIAAAHAHLALMLIRQLSHGWSDQNLDRQRQVGLDVARRAVELKPRSGLCLSALAFALLHCQRWDAAVETARTAVERSSLFAISTRTACAEVLASAGEVDEALTALHGAITLDPFYPPRTRAVLGRALLLAGRREEALVELRRAAVHLPGYAPCLRSIVVAAVELGKTDEAREALVQLRRIQPDWVSASRQALWFLRRPHDVERFLAALAACGDA